MMFKSIFQKEWLKLRFYILISFILIVSTLIYFWFNLSFAFETVEPESMMWYRFIHLGDKPYFYISYLFLLIGVITAFAQFLPEKIQKRIKITLHLPLETSSILWVHLLTGIGFIVVLNTFFSIALLGIIGYYYPYEVTEAVFKDTIAYSFAGIVLYIGLSSVIIEQSKKIVVLKSLLVILFCFVFLKEQYVIEDSLWLLFLLFIPFTVLDSFYSIKQQRLNSFFYKAGFLISVFTIVYLSYINYEKNYKKVFNKYYIFYSGVIEDFVYQKNFGDHRFEYGIKDKTTFDRKTYESYLPFVYWRDLEIQNKLPVKIKDKLYDKQMIKNSRLGFNYNPKMLKEQEVKLYPLFDPSSTQGMIKFPEEFFGIFTDGVKVYDFDHNILENLSRDLSLKLLSEDFIFPAKNIWGKTTNMKPFDKGYLILDSKNKLYSLRREDKKFYIKKIDYPKDLEIEFIRISENRQKKLSGYAIGKKSEFYLLSWDFDFIRLSLEGFDHKIMKLKLFSNPLNYLIRYDNKESYNAAVFSKQSFERIKIINIY